MLLLLACGKIKVNCNNVRCVWRGRWQGDKLLVFSFNFPSGENGYTELLPINCSALSFLPSLNLMQIIHLPIILLVKKRLLMKVNQVVLDVLWTVMQHSIILTFFFLTYSTFFF